MSGHPSLDVAASRHPYATLRSAAVATAVVFAVSGAVFATWVSRLVAVRDGLGAGEAELGLAFLAAGVGSLVSMPLTGRLCARVGSRRAVLLTALPACALLALLPHAPSVGLLAAALFCWGLFFGAWDVAMNVHGSAVQQLARREWMPRYHGCWSVGGAVGAGAGVLAARAGVPVQVHLALAALVCAVVVLVALTHFVDDRVVHAPTAPAVSAPAPSRLLSPRVVAIGVVTLGATCAEGAASDWLALLLADARGAGESAAAGGYAAFAVAMALTRFSGTVLIAWLGRVGALRAAGVVTALGVSLTLTAPGLPGAYAGAVLWGVGIAVVFPAAMSAAGEMPGRSADAIAAVSTIGYGGFLVAPPLIGLLAEQVGLGVALWGLVPVALMIAVLAGATRTVAAAAPEDPAAVQLDVPGPGRPS